MSLSLQELRDELRETTGMDSFDLTDTVADRYLNLSWWDLQDKVKFRERESTSDITLTVGVQAYSLSTISSSLDNVTTVAILPSSTSEYQILNKRDHQSVLEGLNNELYARGLPSEYSIHGTEIFFDPVPDEAYSVRILVRLTLEDIPVGGPAVPQVWHEFVLLGAAMRIFRRNGEFQKSSAIRMERDSLALITVEQMVKETEDFHSAGVRPMRQPYYRGRY